MAFDHAALPIRADLSSALARAWQRLSSAGTWWRGEERLAMVAEARNAARCQLCKDKKAALSANMVQGEHDNLGRLPPAVVDLVHRLATDSPGFRSAGTTAFWPAGSGMARTLKPSPS